MPWQPPAHRPVGWRDKKARDRDYAIYRDKPSLALMQTTAWRKARAEFLGRHPSCVECSAPATVVDHRDPHRGDPMIFWDRSRWRPMCSSCHGRKTVIYDGGFGNARGLRG